MWKANSNLRFNERQREIFFNISIIVIALFVFLFIGEKGYVLLDDSYGYIEDIVGEGFMPVYPLFLLFNKAIFGEAAYLYAVVVQQGILASVCVVCFTGIVKKQFSLNYIESYIIFALTFWPFTIEMPPAMMSHYIMTEGLAYPLFYLFIAMILKAVWNKNLWGVVSAWFMALFLSLIRSQLQVLFGVCGVVFLYLLVMQCKKKKAACIMFRFLTGIAACMVIGILGVRTNVWINTEYMNMAFSESALSRLYQRVNEEQDEERNGEAVQAAQENVQTEQEDEEVRKAFVGEASLRQYTSAIISRGLYEADYEDYRLFEDKELQRLYLYLYAAIDKARYRYAYADNGLWMWKDIAEGVGLAGKECQYVLRGYYEETYPDMDLSEYDLVKMNNEYLTQIGIALLKEHFGRFLYHTLRLLPPSFICTVFFQIAPIYLLCHLVTLFLYLSAIALMIWAFADKKVDSRYAEFMAVILGTNCVFVIVISLVFFGIQRYLIYTFGMFYIAYFLLLVQLWKGYGKTVLEKVKIWRERKKS